MGLIVALLFGVSIGSFLNVVIWRVPRGQSISDPVWSYCPKCEKRLKGYCSQPISWRYFTVEGITGLLFAGIFARYGWAIDTVFYCLFAAVLLAALYIDLDWFMIPDELSVIGFVLGVGLNIVHYWVEPPAQVWRIGNVHILASICSAVAGALIFHVISFAGCVYYHFNGPDQNAASDKMNLSTRLRAFFCGITQDYLYLGAKYTGVAYILPAARRFVRRVDAMMLEEMNPDHPGAAPKSRDEVADEIENDSEQTGMGQGDAKLAAAIGAMLFLKLSLVAYFLAVLMGGVIGIALIAANRLTGRSAIPFGPYLVIGALLALFIGDPLIAWYQHFAFPGSYGALH
jgi:leader peptidase (prepilin peptidase)/N-methyltransferase